MGAYFLFTSTRQRNVAISGVSLSHGMITFFDITSEIRIIYSILVIIGMNVDAFNDNQLVPTFRSVLLRELM